MRQAWFAALAAVMVAISMIAGAAAVLADDDEQEVWDPEVPDVDDVEEPEEDGTASIDGEPYPSLQAALDAAEPGETIVLSGVFEERVTIETPNLTLKTANAAEAPAVIDGDGTDTVLSVDAPDVTVADVWIRDSGPSPSDEDAAVFLNGSNGTLSDVHITDSAYGVWVNGVPNVTIEGATIVGAPGVSVNDRGNGIHLWEADGAHITDTAITQVRDGIYFQWSSDVVAENNRMWDMRYGVHYMYSDDNRLHGNLAFDNDVGFALMVSSNLTITENVAVNNRGSSAHGILVKDIDDSEIRGNDVVNNRHGLYVYNAQDNLIAENLVMENDQGIHLTAGTSGEQVTGNSFIHNDRAAYTTTTTQTAWNASDRGNYWSDARTVDLSDDGTSDVRHRPAGTVERLIHNQPEAAVFAESPAFETVRLAESSFPVVESPGVIDHHPLTETPHDHWREYYEH